MKIRPIVKRFADSVRGNVIMIVALCAPVLIGVAGFAADYGYATYINQGLQTAVDTAVLTATSQSAATAAGGFSNTAYLKTYGTNVFQSNIVKLPVSGVNPNLSVVSNGTGGVVATASYSYSVPTFFSAIVGIPTIPISGKASSTANPVTYINYYFIVDVSQSMGIAATATDMTNLYNRVIAYGNASGGETSCVFGCHVTTNANSGGLQHYTNEYLAHSISPAITLRIDSAVAAMQDVIGIAQTNAGSNQNIKIGLYTMSKDPSTGNLVTQIAAPSTNLTGNSTSVNTLAGNIDLGNNNSNGMGDSDFTNQLTTFNTTYLPVNGSGASAVAPQNYVFIITDGLADVTAGCGPSGHCTGPVNVATCTTLKAKATVGVIYTVYNPIYSNNNPANGLEGNYSLLVAPYNATGSSQIESALQSCASSTAFYYRASDGPGITTGMEALFASSLKQSRLTQ